MMNVDAANARGTLACLLLGALVVSSGCESDSNGAADVEQPSSVAATVELSADEIVFDAQGMPIAVWSEDGVELPLERGEATQGDWIYVARQDRSVEKHRAPNAILREIDTIDYLYLEEETGERVVTQGFKGNAYVNPETNRLCWPAMKCHDPACLAQDGNANDVVVFSRPLISSASVSADGQVVIPSDSTTNIMIPCPQCNSVENVRRYKMSVEILRRSELDAELARVRTARDAGE